MKVFTNEYEGGCKCSCHWRHEEGACFRCDNDYADLCSNRVEASYTTPRRQRYRDDTD